VLATMPRGGRIYIEVKCGPALIAPLARELAAVEGRGLLATIISFDAASVAEAKRRLPAAKALWVTDLEVDSSNGAWTPSAAAIFETLERTGADGVDIRAHAALDRAFADALHARGRELHVWVVNDPAAAARFAALGATSLTTDRPGAIGEAIRASRTHRPSALSNTSPTRVPSRSRRTRSATS
jgi:glycerophosphoryl diester phosphodiesterase